MRADLHMHSVYSDGVYTPLELARRAKEEGFDLISITDHDNLCGEDEKESAMKEVGLPYLRGWEISTVTDRKVHILGYSCRLGKEYEEFVAKRKIEAIERAVELIRKANTILGTSVTLDDVINQSVVKDNVLHPMYTVRAVAKQLGRTDEMGLYEEFFRKGKPGYTVPRRPSPEEAIDIIHRLGGVAVLAHPGRMRKEGKAELFERLLKAGIDGIECYYTTHTPEETEDYLAFAKRNHLYITGGSDYHFEGGKPVFGRPCYQADERFLREVLPS